MGGGGRTYVEVGQDCRGDGEEREDGSSELERGSQSVRTR